MTHVNLRPVFGVILRQFYLMRGSPARVLPLVVWVGIDILLWGFITRYLETFTDPGFHLVTALLGAVLLWGFFGRVMHGVSTAFFEDVWSRNFINLFSAPLSVTQYISGLVITSVLTTLISLIAMVGLASAVFGWSVTSYGLLIVPFLFVLFLSGIALGIFSAGIVLRFGPAAEWLIWPLPAFVSPFVGVFYPLDTLPEWMQVIAWFLAPSYVFEALRTVVSGGTSQGDLLVRSFGLAVLYVALAAAYFVRVYNYSMRSGLLARYSAETVS